MIDTKQKIINAAIEEFAEFGYKRGTVRGICGRAGVNIAAVNYHFSSKRELYSQLFDYLFPRFAETEFPGAERIRDMNDLRERLSGWTRVSLGRFVGIDAPDKERALRIVMYEFVYPSEVRDDLYEVYMDPACRSLHDILEKVLPCEVEPETRRLLEFSLVGRCLFFFYHRYMILQESGNPAFLSDHFGRIVDFLVDETMNMLKQYDLRFEK